MSRNIFLDKKPTRTRRVFSDSRRELDEFFLSTGNPKYFLRVSCGQASIVPCEFLNMAAGSREGELETFFRNFNELLNQVTSSTDHLLLEYLERKLENYMSILFGMICQLEGGKSNDNEPSTENKLMLQLLEELFTLSYGKWEVILQTISEQEVDQSGYYPPKEKTLGRPKFSITKEQLLLLRETGMKWAKVAECLNISERTLYRRVQDYGIHGTFSDISNTELDKVLREILSITPRAGESYIRGSLRSKGILVQRWRVRERLQIIDPIGRAARKSQAIQRRVYNVPAPNCLWHIDSNHKLIGWRIVIHGCIDGYSRTIIYLKCASNNLADTALQFFQSGTDIFGIPSRVRGDMGVENYDIARFMILQGANRGSFITGRSVHNTRIERLWREVNRVVNYNYSAIFKHMEHYDILDSTNEIDLAALHFVFIPRISRSLEEFTSQWNYHGIRTAGYSSLIALWNAGMLSCSLSSSQHPQDIYHYGVDYEMLSQDDSDNHIVVPENSCQLTNDDLEVLYSSIDPLADDSDSGINHFCNARSIILQKLQE